MCDLGRWHKRSWVVELRGGDCVDVTACSIISLLSLAHSIKTQLPSFPRKKIVCLSAVKGFYRKHIGWRFRWVLSFLESCTCVLSILRPSSFLSSFFLVNQKLAFSPAALDVSCLLRPTAPSLVDYYYCLFHMWVNWSCFFPHHNLSDTCGEGDWLHMCFLQCLIFLCILRSPVHTLYRKCFIYFAPRLW